MKPQRRKGRYAIALILLALLLTSCVSSQPATVKETVLPPAVEFPRPPVPFGVEYSEDGKTVTIPSELWVQIAEYYIDVKATEDKYQKIREEYSK